MPFAVDAVNVSNGDQTATVRGIGVDATKEDTIQMIDCGNDRVLGVPHATVLGKIRTDPILK